MLYAYFLPSFLLPDQELPKKTPDMILPVTRAKLGHAPTVDTLTHPRDGIANVYGERKGTIKIRLHLVVVSFRQLLKIVHKLPGGGGALSLARSQDVTELTNSREKILHNLIDFSRLFWIDV